MENYTECTYLIGLVTYAGCHPVETHDRLQVADKTLPGLARKETLMSWTLTHRFCIEGKLLLAPDLARKVRAERNTILCHHFTIYSSIDVIRCLYPP